MMLRAVAVLVGVVAAAPIEAQERQGRTPLTDQTIPVTRGARLAIDNDAGEIAVRAWQKDAVRVQARHSPPTRINIRNATNIVNLTATASAGPPGSVDYDIMAPAWMPVTIEGQFNYVTIEGLQSDVSVETVRGDIALTGGAGTITLSTIEGEIVLEGARGKIDLSTVNQGIRVTGATGEVSAETTNGSITLARVDSRSVEASTINGNVSYDGAIADTGRYSFTTHNGDIAVMLPDSVNATLSVRTYNGDFSSALTLKGPPTSEVKRGKRATYTLGTGGADVKMETFGGAIRLRRAGTPRSSRDQ
jgi:hypothetical protein